MKILNELKLNKEKINIDDLIKEIALPYKDFAQMQEKKINLDLQYKLDNAIKYTAENDNITVKTYSRDNRCFIEVIDTGIGISKEAAKRVFDRFYREDKARSREKGGTGLRTFNSTHNSKIAWRKYQDNAK